MLGSHILYLKGMRRMMFQLSGFDYMGSGSQSQSGFSVRVWGSGGLLRVPIVSIVIPN